MSRVHHLLIDAEYTFVGVENEILREEDAVTLETYYGDDIRELGRFAVVYNMPGYLPESDPVYFDDEAEAEQYVRECRLADEDARTTGYVYDIVDMAQ
jgi:hypothetical protein